MSAYTYACAEFPGMEGCPGKFQAGTESELWELIKTHAQIAHGEDANQWDQETRGYIQTLIKPV